MVQEFSRLNVEIVNLRLSRLQSVLKGYKVFSKALRHIQPDLIHCHGFRDMCFIALLAKKYPRIATIHCDFDVDYQMKYGKLMGKLMAALQWKALQHFSACICVSHSLADLLNQRQNKIHFDYVNNGIDTAIFHPVTDKNSLRKELGLPLNKVIFIWVGSFIQCKNPLCLVNAIKQVKEQNAFFVFCGARGPLLEKAKQQLQGFKNVLFTGYTNQVAWYLQASDCYISTSLSEGFHLSVYEALACELPVILSNLPAYAFLKQAKCSLFFSPHDANSLCEYIQNISHGLDISDQINKGKELISNHFSAKLMSSSYQHLYEACLK